MNIQKKKQYTRDYLFSEDLIDIHAQIIKRKIF